ncbi:gliding motility-associated C-terminal domain-containing protein [Flavitalea sp. BT771]|uniref:T9SS type B sorting domain-containing protein n=1 Tax=Flavitalea sp. BT771 TaxID=3063329 RepID=UPI0026E19CEE|nr:gliding motility-associated C-terminal domain-containing protein [Flavitalea sp. BT771]MDO6433208.1 gliding motility-associated C-terminal domain-containing protein [Flavitalea sp. BT771]MDV6221516.1 gliding motility-associated C-terminal domain-containing protein [Flavitalea sp. BT771]
MTRSNYRLLFCIFLLITAAAAKVQAQCQKTFKFSLKGPGSEFIYDIVQLPGGDKILAGQIYSVGAGGWDIFLTRMKNDGTILWNKTYGGGGDEEIRKIRLAGNGNILITGSTRSYGNPAGETIAMNIDPSGVLQWSVKLGESSGYSLGLDIMSTSDNGFVVCGSNYSGLGTSDWMVTKLGTTGNIQWSQRLDFSINEDAFSLFQKGDTVVVCGDSQNPGQYSGIIVKFSLPTGAIYSSAAYNVDGRGFFAPKIQPTLDQYRIGMHIIDFSSYGLMQEGFLMVDTFFNIAGAFKINITPYNNFYFNGLWLTHDSGYIVSGSSAGGNEGYLYRFDKNNNLLATHRFNSTNPFLLYSAIEAADSTIWLVGSENNHALVIKLNADGEFEYCNNQPVTASTQAMSSSQAPFTWTNVNAYNFVSPPIVVNTTGFNFLIDSLCFAPVCKQILLSGKDTICSTRDTSDYKISLANLCNGTINWAFPPGTNVRMVNDTFARVNFQAGGHFKIKATKNAVCSLLSDSVEVFVAPSPDSIHLGNDTILCHPANVVLDAGTIFKDYRWQDNSQLQTYSTSRSGVYFVQATDYCNEIRKDTIQISFHSQDSAVASPDDTSYCIPSPVQLRSKGGDTYVWTPAAGLSDPTISNPIATPGASVLYSVKISDTVCNWSTDRFVNLFIDPLPTIRLSKSNDVDCLSGTTHLAATGGSTYQWTPAASLDNPNTSSPIAIPIETTTYTVKAFNSLGCAALDSITVVFSKTGDPSFYLPNAFSPNGDGHNDLFRIDTRSTLKLYEFSVYDRWGARVFTTTDPSKGWDGYFNGVPQKADIFVWFVRAWTPCTGEIFKKGTVMLIR